MTYQNFVRNLFKAIAASVFIVGIYSHAWASGDTEAKPLELRRIMQEIGKNMQTITTLNARRPIK